MKRRGKKKGKAVSRRISGKKRSRSASKKGKNAKVRKLIALAKKRKKKR